jgi:hypothetical protein
LTSEIRQFLVALSAVTEEYKSEMEDLLSKFNSFCDNDGHQEEMFVNTLSRVMLSLISDEDLVRHFVSSVIKCISGGDTVRLQDIGSAWVWLGLVTMELQTPYVSVDPVEKVAIKLEILQNEVIA